MNIDNTTIINNIIINTKFVTYPFNPVFLMLLAVQSFEIFAKHKEYFCLSCFELTFL